jgi:hypothetical protein
MRMKLAQDCAQQHVMVIAMHLNFTHEGCVVVHVASRRLRSQVSSGTVCCGQRGIREGLLNPSSRTGPWGRLSL